ncbi:uncharacterized protein LTR77_008324 [Saxophila tyrrhenica]|uniref:Zn(2)-C6 fungal-type domain-containing protein n=1 Tax=Saxophila tyrrhenica TaxID=1690608 RepID=A0AAV9P4R1_9PEZI|nr:hypothetical protein LTR77_008324 [Saxophila tyrrhenica]
MPQDHLLPDLNSARRTLSPEPTGGSERKRRRKVLSCYDCRRRKLQCDRAMPACSRCTKAGQAADCLYIDDATDLPVRHADSAALANAEFSRGPFEGHQTRPIQAPAPTTVDTLSRLEYQDRRIKQLETALIQSTQLPSQPFLHQPKASKFPLTPESPGAIVEQSSGPLNITDRETMLLRGKSFKTQFHGITHPGSLIAYIPELSAFTKETFERIPALLRIRQDMKQLEDRTPYAASLSRQITDADLKAQLTSRAEVDQLVQLYLDNYDNIYHIIHLPSFRREYNDWWTHPQQAKGSFVALIVLMTATAQCLQPTEPWLYTANSSTARERAISAIHLCERWLEGTSQKHVSCVDFQIRFLMNLARLVNAHKFKRTWTDAGTMIRFFMAAGLHRSPDLLRKPTSALDKEMRRRLWAAASEFELQAAFGRGMISAPFPQQSDCPPPSNIHDEDITSESEPLPPPRPSHDFTNSSYMVFAADSFSLRYTLNTVLNNIRQTISFDDAKRYTEEIESHLSSLPNWIGTSSEPPRALLSITLRQYILVLHDRQFRQAKSQYERDFSKLTLLTTASKIISTHKDLVSRGCRALQLLCQDQLRAALSVCHIASTPDPSADALLTNMIATNAATIINDTADNLTDKITRYGREQRQLWIVLAANGFMKAKRDPDSRLLYMQEAVDKIIRPYYKIMACQEETPTTIAGDGVVVREERRMEMPNGMNEYLPDHANGQAGETGGGEMGVLGFEDLAQWTFEDWGFDGVELGGMEGLG